MAKRQVDERLIEWQMCSQSPAYFIDTYCRIYDGESRDWIAFELWKEQYETLMTIHANQYTIVLKARQLGLTWLLLAYGLWLMLFRPIATILIFSKRDDEAVYLAGDERLRGMYHRLPIWMKAKAVEKDDAHVLMLSNGSVARAFPTSGGDGYTATLAIVDEADLVPDLPRLMNAVKPTIDAGGKIVLISKVDKAKPQSLFKQIYRAAKDRANEWKSIFLAWYVRPGRSQEWYDAQVNDALKNTGSLDDIHENYPATDAEALAPRSLDKRFPPKQVEQCYQELVPLATLPPGAPDISDLKVFRLPQRGRHYVIGMDCAEGLPNSDDSATDVLDKLTGEQVAKFAGKFEPSIHAANTAKLALWYNQAAIMVENNNHGWSAILWFKSFARRLTLLKGHNEKDGWSTTTLSKVIMYDAGAETLKNNECIIHDFTTLTQLQSIEKSTLNAPETEMDDQATSFLLANVARSAAVDATFYDDSYRVEIGY